MSETDDAPGERLYRTPASNLGEAPRGFRIGAVLAGLASSWLGTLLALAVLVNLPLAAIGWAGPSLGLSAVAACIGGGFVAATVGRPRYWVHAASVGAASALPMALVLMSPRFTRGEPLRGMVALTMLLGISISLAWIGAALARWRQAAR